MKLLGVSLDGKPIYIVTEYCGKASKMTKVLLFFIFLYFDEFFFCYVLHFFYTLTYEYVGKNTKKKGKEKLNIHISQTHTQLLTDKKERKKHTSS